MVVVMVGVALLAGVAPMSTAMAADEPPPTQPETSTPLGSPDALVVAADTTRSMMRRDALRALRQRGMAGLADASSGSIAGTVSDREGQGLAGICVAALRAPIEHPDAAAAVALTGSAGDYALRCLEPGPYRLFFLDCRDDPTYAVEYFPGSATFADAVPVEVETGQQIEGGDVRMFPGASVTGTVVDA